MTEFLIYQGKAAIALAVFYMFYRLLLSKETFHRLNRIVLLGTAALSFVLPLCVITFKKVVVLPAMKASSESYADEMAETVAMAAEASEPIWPVILCSLFAAGALVVVIKTLVSIIGIRRIIRSGSSQTLESGETLIITETDTAPFSWMKFIVLSREDYECGYTQILTHERAHIALRHSWDLLFTDLITTFQWFNPAIWMLRADLRALHEFEADDAVLRSGADIREYQYLLIRKAVSKSGYSVANSLNHSTLKQRITMMLNKKSSRMSAWKALYVIPLVGISLAATAETKVDYRYEDQQPEAVTDTLKGRVVKVHDTADGKDSKNSLPEPKSEFTKKNLREGRFMVDKENNTVTLIYFDNDCKELQICYTGLDLNENIYMHNGAIVTKDMQMKAAKDDPDAVVIVAYLKDNNRVSASITTTGPYVTGKITVDDQRESMKEDSTIVLIGARADQDDKADVARKDLLIVVNGEKMPEDFDLNTISPNNIASMEVLKTEEAMKEYGTDKGVIVIATKPAENDDTKPVPDIYINGKKAESEDIAALPANPNGTIAEDGTVWITTDESSEAVLNRAPSFNGGSDADFQKWVHANIRYPEGTSAEGRVSVSFTVSETGKVINAKALRGPDQKLIDEAVRAISSSPDWSPALKDGKPVAIKMVIPVYFKK